MDTFGEWLRQQRNNRSLTRDEFASRVGCSIALLRKIEDGERRPSVQIAELIAGCLNIPLEDRPTFIKVARGEWNVDHLSALSEQDDSPVSQCCNLPVFPTPLIGRQREMEELHQLLDNPQCRMLSLVGPGGIGKTRLAIETASLMQDTFADGVYFVSLAPVNTTRFILPIIASTIGFGFKRGSRADPKSQLISYIREKQGLLLFDSIEHLLFEPGIEILAELLANAPQVKMLVTSREPAGLQGEWIFEVHGLPIPESQYIEGRAKNTSVELFLQRARRAHVGFNATVEDYPVIVRICQLVDGMPLGIELAAAWVRTLSCSEIAQEIENGLDFLRVSTRDLPPRHRSMRAVFDHSWKLLTGEEQMVLLQLSVFQGGFSREAAEIVAGATLSTLSNLVMKSIIRRSGSGRYDLHELIRQFSVEHFTEQPHEQTATRARHGNYILTYFCQAEGRLGSSTQKEVLNELTAEMDNFRAAWDWAIATGEFALIEQSLRTFAMLYDNRGWYQEGLENLDRAIHALEAAPELSQLERINQLALAHILSCRAYIAFRLTQVEQAQGMLERSLEILRPLNDSHILVESLAYLGLVMIWTGNYPRALELLTEGLTTANTIGDHWFSAVCLTQKANVLVMMGDSEIGHTQLQSAVTNWRDIGDLRFTAYALNLLSLSALALGRYAEARASLEECVELNISVGDRWGLGLGFQGLGRVAQAQGFHDNAVEMFGKGLEIFNDLGARRDVARILAEMGRSHYALGNDTEAMQAWLRAIQIASETQGAHVALEALVGIARLQAKQGHGENALELLLIVINNPASVKETKDRAIELQAEVEANLTKPQIKAAATRVQAKTFEGTIDEVLTHAA